MSIQSPHLISLTACLLVTASAAATGAAAPSPAPAASDVFLEQTGPSIARISARFPSLPPGGQVTVSLDGTKVLMTDAGANGDVRARDGEYSAVTAFDFAAFFARNRELASNLNGARTQVFAPGGRELTGVRQLSLRADRLVVEQEAVDSPVREVLTLPLTAPKASKTGLGGSAKSGGLLAKQALPVGGPALGLPVGVAASPVTSEDSLLIRKLSVVNDPDRTFHCPNAGGAPVGNPQGAWTFWTLMEHMANGTAPTEDYIRALFKTWTADQHINGFTAQERPNVYQEIIEVWEQRSGGGLDPSQSPFRLLAIVSRLDLRGPPGTYGGGEAGEARFVFSVHDGECNNLPMTVILEYKVPLTACEDIRDWANQWIDLASSSNYNQDLQALTDLFSTANAAPNRPNGSAIGQVRTNEFLPWSPEWELREFNLPKGGGFLAPTTVKQEPDKSINNTTLLAKYLISNATAILAGQHVVPLQFMGSKFLGASAPAPQLWDAPLAPGATSNNDDVKFNFALSTCSGCHTVETQTAFAHIDYNTPVGVPADLSGFLSGTQVPDARVAGITRSFDDLARRALDLQQVAQMSCDVIPPQLGNALLQTLTAPAPLKIGH